MQKSTRNTILVLAILAVGGYFIFRKKYAKEGTNNWYFNDLITNLGTSNLQAKDDILVVPFNDKKNYAQFYTNGRVAFFDSNKKLIVKGSFSDGGKKIVLDGGKTIKSNSVWTNLVSAINK